MNDNDSGLKFIGRRNVGDPIKCLRKVDKTTYEV